MRLRHIKLLTCCFAFSTLSSESRSRFCLRTSFCWLVIIWNPVVCCCVFFLFFFPFPCCKSDDLSLVVNATVVAFIEKKTSEYVNLCRHRGNWTHPTRNVGSPSRGTCCFIGNAGASAIFWVWLCWSTASCSSATLKSTSPSLCRSTATPRTQTACARTSSRPRTRRVRRAGSKPSTRPTTASSNSSCKICASSTSVRHDVFYALALEVVHMY